MDTRIDLALRRWREADLLSDGQVEDIRTWEAAHAERPAAPDAPPPPAASRHTSGGAARGAGLIAEGLGYVGAALALGAGLALFGELWDDLGAAARIGLSAVGTAILAGSAILLRDRREGSLGRLATVLAALAVVGVGATVAIALAELGDLDDGWIGVLAGLAAVVAGIPAHLDRESWPTTLALGGAVLTTVFGAQALLDLLDGAAAPGITLMGLGLAWAAAGWAGHARPQAAFEVTGLVVGGVGVQVLAFEELTLVALAMGLLVAGGAMAVGLTEDRTAPAVLGGLGITVYAPQLVFEVFGDAVGGPLALFVGGVTLVTVAVVILRRQVLA